MHQQRDSKTIAYELRKALLDHGIHWDTVEKLIIELRNARAREAMKKGGDK